MLPALLNKAIVPYVQRQSTVLLGFDAALLLNETADVVEKS